MAIRMCCRSVCNHLFLLGAMLFLLLLCRSFPPLFFIFISFSPVLVCTLLLLGILLNFGELSVPQIENEERGYAHLKGESFSIDKCRTFQENSGKTVSNFRALPVLLGMFCFFFIVYISSPFLVSILVRLSPVFVCAVMLVGVIVSFGESNTPENDGIVEEPTIISRAVPEDNEVPEDVSSVHYDRRFSREIYALKRDEGERVEEYELSKAEKLEEFDENIASWKVKCEKWLSQAVQFPYQDLEFENENPKEQNKRGDEEWCIVEMEEEGVQVGNNRLLCDNTNQAGLEAFKHAGHHHHHAQEGNEIIDDTFTDDDCWVDSVDSISNFPSNKVDYESKLGVKHIGKRNCVRGDILDSEKLEDSIISEGKKHEFLNDYTLPSTAENSGKTDHVREANYPEGLDGYVSPGQIHDQEDLMEQYHCFIGPEVCESIEKVKCDVWDQEEVTAVRVAQVEDRMKMIGSTEESKYRKDYMNQHQLASDMVHGPGNNNTSESVDSDSYQDANEDTDQNDGDENSGAERNKQGSYKSVMMRGENDEKNDLCHESLNATERASMDMNFMGKKKLIHQVNAGHLSENSSTSTARCSSPSIPCEYYDVPFILDSAPPTSLLIQDPVDLPVNPTEEKTGSMEDGSEGAVMMRHQRQESSFLQSHWLEETTFICNSCKQKFLMPHQKNSLFRRVRSFEIFLSGHYRQESLEMRKPYFAGEKSASEEAKITSLCRFSELGDKLDESAVSFFHETGSVFSTTDPQDEKLSGNDIFYETEMILDMEQFSEQVKCGSHSDDRIDVAETEQYTYDTDADQVAVERRNSWIPQEVELSSSATRNNHVKFGRSDVQLAADFAEEEWKISKLSSSVCRSETEREISHASANVKVGVSRKLQKVEKSLDTTRRFLNHMKSGRTETPLHAESAEEKPDKSSFLSPVRNARRNLGHDSFDLQTGGSRNLQEVLTSVNATRDTSMGEESSRSHIHLAAPSKEADCDDSSLVSLVLRRNAERDSKHEDIDAEMWYLRSLKEVGKSMADNRYISNIVASDESAARSVEAEHGKSGILSSVLRKYDVDVEYGGVGKQKGDSSCRSKVESSLEATRGQFNLVKSTRSEIQLAEEESDTSNVSFSTLKKDTNIREHDMIDALNGHSGNVREVETSWAATRNIFDGVCSRRVEAQVTEAHRRTNISSSGTSRNVVCDVANRYTRQGQPFSLKNGKLQNGFAENGCTVNLFVPGFDLKTAEEDNYDHKDGDREEDASSDSRSSSWGSSSSDMSVDGLIQTNDFSDEESKTKDSSILSSEDSENPEETTDEDDENDREDEVACTNIIQLNLQGFCTKGGYLMQERRNTHLFSRICCTRSSASKLISKREVII